MKNKIIKYFSDLNFFHNLTEKRVYLLAVGIRIAFLIYVVIVLGDKGLVMMGDSPDYLVIAQKFVEHHSMLWADTNDVFETTRLPGYPFFLSLFLFFHAPFFFASVFQILLGGFIPILIMRMASRFGLSTKISLFTGVLCAIEPAGIVYGVMLLPDVFNALLFILGFYYLVVSIQKKFSNGIFIPAIIFALVNYIRPAGLFLGILLPIFLVLYSFMWDRENIKIYFKNAIIFLIIFFATLSPWMLRNYIHYDVFSFASGIERQIYEITAVGVRASSEGISHQESLLKMRQEILPVLIEPRDLASFKNNGLMIKPALNIIISNPVNYIKLYIMSLITFFSSGNYHYIGSVFGFLNSSDVSTSYTMIYAKEGLLVMLKTLFLKITTPYSLTIVFGRLLWMGLFILTLIGIYLKRKDENMRPVTMLFVFICLYMIIVISHLTVGIEARHRLFLNPFYYLFTIVSVHAIIALLKNIRNVYKNTK